MSDRILVGTRKGTFIAEKSGRRWVPRLAGHGGMGVNFVARDPHSGTLWAAPTVSSEACAEASNPVIV